MVYYSEFSNERLRVERRAQFHKVRSKLQFQQALERYLEWITRAGENHRSLNALF